MTKAAQRDDLADWRRLLKRHGRRVLLRAVAINALYNVLYATLDDNSDSAIRCLGVALALFLLPGAAWFAPSRHRLNELTGPRVLWVILVSLGAFTVTHAALALSTSAWSAAKACAINWAVANGLLITRLIVQTLLGERGGRDAPKHRRNTGYSSTTYVAAFLIFSATYSVYYLFAMRVVAPLEDHGQEVQGTAHALLTRLTPLFVTDRTGYYFFAHPLLLHYYVSGSFLLHDRLDGPRFYTETSALVANGVIDRLTGHRRILQHYMDFPEPASGRTPNIFLAAFTVALLSVWLSELTGRPDLGALIATCYGLAPEVVVRSSYGGYFAISQFAMVVGWWAYERWLHHPSGPGWRLCLSAGVFAALANHKLVLAVAAMGLWEFVRRRGGGISARIRATAWSPVLLGFLVGTLAFWVYGLAIDAQAFVQDHVRGHLVDRISSGPTLGTRYPSPTRLWVELFRNAGYVIVPLGLAVILFPPILPVSALRQWWKAIRRRWPVFDPWAIWVMTSAATFTLVDWRQTKHLMPLLLATYCLPGLLASAGPAALKRSALFLYACILVWNLRIAVGIADAGVVGEAQTYFLSVTPDW